jgi:ferric-dicitrate binding protein FerR (iron transport regulator)
MRPSESIRIVTVIVTFFTLSIAQTTLQETALPVGSAVVTEIKGDAVLTSAEGTLISRQRGTTLSADSKIETAKGSVLLELQDGSQILVRAHSNVVLRAPNEGKGYSLELFIGKIVAKIQKRMGGAPSFRMGTPSAVITVRGTRFSVEVNKKARTYVEVYEGLVQVGGLAEGSHQVLIQPGFSTDVENERGPEEPRQTSPGEGREGGREDGRENEGPGRTPNNEDQHRTPSQPRPPNQGGESGKPD